MRRRITGAIVPPPPRLSLPSLATLCARAELAVGVDTGLVHLAAALGTPTVSLFVATTRRVAASDLRVRRRATWGASASFPRPTRFSARRGIDAPRACLLMDPVRGLYSLLWNAAVPLAPLRLAWRGRREPGYRELVGERYGRYRDVAPPRILWVHAVSLGETRAPRRSSNAFAARIPKPRFSSRT
jgi:hypothetical protein